MDFMLRENLSVPSYLELNLGPDCIWVDEFSYSRSVTQTVRLTLDGTAVIEYLGLPAAGVPLTFECGWHTKATVDQLVTIRDRAVAQQLTMRIMTCDGRYKYVVWDHGRLEPVEIRPVLPRPDYDNVPNPDWYDVKLYFLDAFGFLT